MSRSVEKTREAVESRFLGVLQQVFGENLYSVLLYGSYVRGNFMPGVSDVNALILLHGVDPRQLESLTQRAYRLMQRHNITPLILSAREFARSADVYPMEYMDITDRHSVLFGPDATRDITFHKQNLRHELEHQLRGNLVSLRQMLVASKNNRRLLGNRLKRWYGTMGALFRGLLRLAEADEVPEDPGALVVKVNEVFGLEPGPFTRLIEFRNGAKGDPAELARGVLERMATLVDIVDTTDTGRQR